MERSVRVAREGRVGGAEVLDLEGSMEEAGEEVGALICGCVGCAMLEGKLGEEGDVGIGVVRGEQVDEMCVVVR